MTVLAVPRIVVLVERATRARVALNTPALGDPRTTVQEARNIPDLGAPPMTAPADLHILVPVVHVMPGPAAPATRDPEVQVRVVLTCVNELLAA